MRIAIRARGAKSRRSESPRGGPRARQRGFRATVPSVRFARDETGKFEPKEGVENLGNRRTRESSETVDADTLSGGQSRKQPSRLNLLVGGGRRRYTQDVEDVRRREHGSGARSQQAVGSGGEPGEDGTGNGHDFSTLVEGVASGDQCAGSLVGLNYHDDAGESGDQAVALGEVVGQWRTARRVFGEETTMTGDFIGKPDVLGGVGAIGATAPDGHGEASGGERPAVSGGIHTTRHAGSDPNTCGGELPTEVLRNLAAISCGAAGTDESDAEACGQAASDEQAKGGVAQAQEAFGERRVPVGQEAPAQPGKLPLDLIDPTGRKAGHLLRFATDRVSALQPVASSRAALRPAIRIGEHAREREARVESDGSSLWPYNSRRLRESS